MSSYIVKDTELTSVANAIRTAGGTNNSLTFPNGFVSAVENISGGGGGDSDFSTAQVTVVNSNSDEAIEIYSPFRIAEGETRISVGRWFIEANETLTFNIIMYAERASMEFGPGAHVTSASGDVTTDGDSCVITGDCTITIS